MVGRQRSRIHPAINTDRYRTYGPLVRSIGNPKLEAILASEIVVRRVGIGTVCVHLGIAPRTFIDETRAFARAIAGEMARLESTRDGEKTLAELLRRPEVRYADIAGHGRVVAGEVAREVETQTKYAGYIERARACVERLAGMNRQAIPGDFDFWALPALRHECREKLDRIRPANLGQAGRVPGVTPADLAVLSVALKRADSQNRI